MLYETISSHAGLQDLQARFLSRPRPCTRSCSSSDEHTFVYLVSLESVRIARESYVLVRSMMELVERPWACAQVDPLSVVAAMSLELHKVEHDLLPPLLVQGAKLEGGVVEALIHMKNSAITLLRLEKEFKEALDKMGESLEEDQVAVQVKGVGVLLKDTAVHLLQGTRTIDWFQKERAPCLLEFVNALLATPPKFVFSGSDSDTE